MSKIKKNNELNLVRSVNKNVRSSTRKLKPILKALVGKKVDYALRDLEFSNKRICVSVLWFSDKSFKSISKFL